MRPSTSRPSTPLGRPCASAPFIHSTNIIHTASGRPQAGLQPRQGARRGLESTGRWGGEGGPGPELEKASRGRAPRAGASKGTWTETRRQELARGKGGGRRRPWGGRGLPDLGTVRPGWPCPGTKGAEWAEGGPWAPPGGTHDPSQGQNRELILRPGEALGHAQA